MANEDTTRRRAMADDEKTPAAAARDAVKDKHEASSDAPSFPRELLIDGGLTRYESHVVAGALSLLGSTPKNLSIEECEAAVKAWLDAPVKEA